MSGKPIEIEILITKSVKFEKLSEEIRKKVQDVVKFKKKAEKFIRIENLSEKAVKFVKFSRKSRQI